LPGRYDVFQYVAECVRRSVAFRTWSEARELWDRLLDVFPQPEVLVLMPDHVHLKHGDRDHQRFRQALGSYAQWRNRHRGEAGQVWEPVPAPQPYRNPGHSRTNERYLLLNPCRAGLARCPLAWPFSTHRDAVGLAFPSCRPPVADPERYHAWVSGDPSVAVTGTALPSAHAKRAPTLEEVAAAVSALTRTPAQEFGRPGAARDLFIRAARNLGGHRQSDVATRLGVDARTVRRTELEGRSGPDLVQRVVGDPRFAALDGRDLRVGPGWQAYRHRR
jgi:hypothetical protein